MRKFIPTCFIVVLSLSLILLGVPGVASAQDHIVNQSDLQKDVAHASSARQANQARLENFLKTPVAAEAMSHLNADYATVQKGVATLSDQEVANLAARADKAQADFAGGFLSWAELLLIAIAVIVIIIIVVKA